MSASKLGIHNGAEEDRATARYVAAQHIVSILMEQLRHLWDVISSVPVQSLTGDSPRQLPGGLVRLVEVFGHAAGDHLIKTSQALPG